MKVVSCLLPYQAILSLESMIYSVQLNKLEFTEVMMDRPITTLFMLMSLDGKISPGASDDLDVDKDFPKIDGLKEGLPQYYEIEQTTDLWSFNTGRVQEKLSLKDALCELKSSYGCERLTIQSGGTVNGLFLREKLFDYVDVVVAPVLVGGKETASLIDGRSILSENELSELGVLKLIDCTVLNHLYIRVRYQVVR